ncbi:MAG: PBP1A family penicillin-binding protein [Acidobacteriaceae bacterium]|nr:PBP1A family penicillin-binding protein [Acidobacteriaceae bacterium]
MWPWYVAIGLVAILVSAVAVLGFTYAKYANLADEKLIHGPIPKSSLLYGAPEVVGVGDAGTPLQLASRLRESGYAEDGRANAIGWYHLRPDAIEIFPGQQAFTRGDPGVIRFSDGKISAITDLSDQSTRTEYTIEPELLSSLYDKNREKRRIVRYEDLPPVLVNALVSAEDKRFFQHSGFDPVRIAKAAMVDVREHRRAEGASTLTQQLARMLWLDNRKTIGRKVAELMITIHLERKLSKEKILEYYANQVPLGRRGTFAIRGFGEAAQAYFGKGVRQLTLPEAATLAGLIQEPSFRNPVRWPERARARRNVVLRMMLDNGYISKSQYELACASPMTLARQGAESAEAPYFVDLVNEQLSDDFEDHDFQDSGSRIYTTLDPELQRDAMEAVATGMKEVDSILAKRRKKGIEIPDPQVALICLDPHTGEVKALVGGRNYGMIQLDHAIAKRPSGSVFKPIVYAAALNTGLADASKAITPSTLFEDEPHTFYYDGKPYEPADFHHGEWMGDVTLRTALAHSLNVPAVEVAEATGFSAVADLAHKVGLEDIRPTPAMALGAYDVTPLDIAGAYTVFANKGVMVKPRLISKIADASGKDVWTSDAETEKILDPRVNFLMVSMMQEVLRSGSGARVHAYGFNLPAAGKTGTSHDAWFAGFTSNLLCVVWVGLDDYQDLKVEGAHAALPVWAEFMKQAHKLRAYRDVTDFAIPEGVVSSQIDPDSGDLATSACPKVQTEFYLVGTQPTKFCPLHQGGATELAGWDTPNVSATGGQPVPIPAQQSGTAPPFPSAGSPVYPPGSNQQPPPPPPQPERKGFFGKLKSIFR